MTTAIEFTSCTIISNCGTDNFSVAVEIPNTYMSFRMVKLVLSCFLQYVRELSAISHYILLSSQMILYSRCHTKRRLGLVGTSHALLWYGIDKDLKTCFCMVQLRCLL